MAFANERQWDLRDCSSLCNTCKENKKKRNGIFHPLLNHRLTPISGHKSGGEKCKCEGPLVAPKVTVHSATVNNSKKVASAKVNIFYSDIPVPGGVPGCPRTEGRPTHVLSLAGSLAPGWGGLLLRPFRGFRSVCSSWSPCSSGCAWGAGGCSRCPWSAASASRSGSSTWSRPGVRVDESHTHQRSWPSGQLFYKSPQHLTYSWRKMLHFVLTTVLYQYWWRNEKQVSLTWSLQKKGPGWRRQTWHMESSR